MGSNPRLGIKMTPKLLVSIVNYKDPEFFETVRSLWDTCDFKDSIVFSLVDEDETPKDFSFIPEKNLIYRYYPSDKYYGGLCWARNLATQVDFDYEYFVQFDSHSRARNGWDRKGYENYKYIEAAFPEEKVLICYAPPSYFIDKEGNVNLELETNKFGQRAVWYKDLVPGYEFPGYRELTGTEVAKTYWTTCMYMFAPKAWIDEVGVDGVGAFSTEEFNQSIRTFSKGWSIYAIGARDVFHQHHDSWGRNYTKAALRPWGDERENAYWDHVLRATNHLGRLLAGLEDVPIEKVKEFFKVTEIDERFLGMSDAYYDMVNARGKALGMPPRPNRNGMPPLPSPDAPVFKPDRP